MRTFLPLICILSAIGCSSSSDTNQVSSNALVGTWLSNCHEFFGTENEAGNNRYKINEVTFTDSEYVDNFVSYTDINCTIDPIEESIVASYTVGEMVVTTDGVDATRMSITAVVPGRPDVELMIESIYRISGVDLNFGVYTEGEIPSIVFLETFTKQ